MANKEAEKTDSFKKYNEMLKTFESLVAREAELLQKLSQADGADPSRKQEWADELASVIKAAAALNKKRKTLLKKLHEEIKAL